MHPIHALGRLRLPMWEDCRIPEDLESVTFRAEEAPLPAAERAPVDGLWRDVEGLYCTGVHPAIQVCIRHRGEVVLHRAIGHASGNAPQDPPDAVKVPVTTETPFTIFSAAKAITAMVIHKLDEQRVLHLEDRVCEFVPEFTRFGKHRITLRHLLAHRAGIANLPPEAIDLDLLGRPDRVVEILAEARPRTRPGRILAYHAVSGGFVLGEVVRRATGQDIRAVLEKEIADPLGFGWMRYGVRPGDEGQVAHNAFTGPPVPPPMSQILRRALGTGIREVVELSNDPRFLRGVIPSANIVTTAAEAAAFYQCLLNEGELDGVRIFDPRTVRHASAEQSYWELDLTLGLPLRYGLGFMLGGHYANLFGWDNFQAFGHVGLSNIFTWADPQRELAVAILTSGKPILSLHALSLMKLLVSINLVFPKIRAW